MDATHQDNSFDFDPDIFSSNAFNDAIQFQKSLPSRTMSLYNVDEVPAADLPESSTRLTCQHGSRPRAKVIPEHIWNKHRHAIEYLYLERDLKLAQVREEMIANHGFDASVSMYKKRLTDWKSRKNYAQAQKKKIISKLAIAGFENQSTPTVELNGKPIKTQRLYRRVQRQGECFSIASHPNHAVRRAMKYHRASIQGTSRIERHILQQSPQSRDVEQFLRSAHRYYTWYNTQTEFEYQIDSCGSLVRFWEDMRTGFQVLTWDSAAAFACLNRSCGEINSILKQQPFQFLLWLVDEVTIFESKEGYCSQISRSVLKFIASSSYHVLGISHPVTECVNLISTSAERDDCLSLMTTFSQLLIDIVQAMPASEEKVQLLSDLVDSLAGRNIENQFVERILETLKITQSQSTHPTKVQRRVLRTAIGASYFRGEYTTSEELCRKQIEWSIEITGRPEGDFEGSRTCDYLGCIYSEMHRFDESDRFSRLALDGYIALACYSDALRVLTDLEEDLEARGKHKELDKFREEYRYIYADLEEWKLDPAQFEHELGKVICDL